MKKRCNNCDKELNDVYACLFTRWYCLYCAWSIAEDKEKYPWIDEKKELEK